MDVTCASFLRLVGVVPGGGVATISPPSYPCLSPSDRFRPRRDQPNIPYSLLISRIPTAQVHHVRFLTFKVSDRDSIVFNVVAIAAVSISLSRPRSAFPHKATSPQISRRQPPWFEQPTSTHPGTNASPYTRLPITSTSTYRTGQEKRSLSFRSPVHRS